MSFTRGLIHRVSGWLSRPVATPETDPQQFFGLLNALPNPDPILRQMGTAERVHHAILADAHVIGEIRSIRGSFRSHQYRLIAGNEADSKSLAARDLCEAWMAETPPNAVADWLEVMWQMTSAILTGYRPHEVVWGYKKHSGKLTSNKYLPTEVLDRPNRRFLFDASAAPLLVSKEHLQGAPVEPFQFVISRHMASTTNPYGLALLSSCFWPWTFKTGGWRYFVKFCERHGLPWPVGRYPQGTTEEDQDKLAEALGAMIESGYVVVQEGTGLELLTPSGGAGELPQERLIVLTNREMSKALTSQAMIGEQLKVGSRAASETAKDRQDSVHDSDRDIAGAGMAQIFQWITLFNFGEGVSPPTVEFFHHTVAGKDRAATYKMAADMGARPSRKAMLDELDIPEAVDEEDALLPRKAAQESVPPGKTRTAPEDVDFSALEGFTFAKAAGMTEDEALQLAIDAADSAIEDRMIAPIYQMLVEFESAGKTLAEFQAALENVIGVMDEDGLREVLDRAIAYSILRGAATNAS
jgi:phage gp29-like protein